MLKNVSIKAKCDTVKWKQTITLKDDVHEAYCMH